jgi:hypothetical protein
MARLSVISTTIGLLLLISPNHAQGQNIYIAQIPAGAANGTSCSNAYAYTFFNSAANWGSFGSNQIRGGTSVHICGTLGNVLTFQASGTAGNPITLVFEAGASMSAPTWGGVRPIKTAGGAFSWLVLDGGSNGVIEATANGTTLATQNNDGGVDLGICNNCTVRNLTIRNMYVHTSPIDEAGEGSDGISVTGSNVTLNNNTISDTKQCIAYVFPGTATSSNVNIYGNTLYHCDHGVQVGGGNTNAILSNVLVHDNVMYDGGNWDDNSDKFHHDRVHVWSVLAGDQLTGVQIYNNYIYGDWGIHETAHIFVEANSGGTDISPLVFNNVLVNNASIATHAPADGFIYNQGQGAGIYNNTMVYTTSTNSICFYNQHVDGSGGLGVSFNNNIAIGCSTGIYDPAGSTLTSDFNDWYNLPSTNAMVYTGSFYNSFTNWRSATGFDSHSLTSNPNLDATFKPQTGSPVIGSGEPLASLGITFLNIDKAGVTRSGSWTMGAYQNPSGSAGPNPPTGLVTVVR